MKRNRLLLVAVVLLAFAVSGSQAAAQSCPEPRDDLLAWWAGDGNAMEVVSGLHGTPLGGAGFDVGLVDAAFYFDGMDGDSRVVLPRLALDGLADLTVEFWMNTTEADQGGLISAANGHPSGDNELLMLHMPTGLLVIVKQTGVASIPIVLNDGVWHHVAFVREADSGHLYVDGVLVDVRSYPVGPLDVGPRGLLLGQEQDCLGDCFDPAQAFDGSIDELAIHHRALSTNEVAEIFAAGSAGRCKDDMEPPTREDLVDRVLGLEQELDDLRARVEDLESGMLHAEGVMMDFMSTLYSHEHAKHDKASKKAKKKAEKKAKKEAKKEAKKKAKKEAKKR